MIKQDITKMVNNETKYEMESHDSTQDFLMMHTRAHTSLGYDESKQGVKQQNVNIIQATLE